ncbi:MAG: hypothetical protein OEW15_19020 [Nitrospirota bacterium]|nr:hypothetical protein [Nitrospirota bacterium]
MDYILTVFNSYEIDWTAASAIGTFMAVIVALHPIWEARRNQKTMAVSLRARALLKMYLLRDGLIRMQKGITWKAELNAEELNAIQALEIIATNPTGLTLDEQESLLVSVGLLQTLSSLTQSAHVDKVPDKARETLSFLETFIKHLQSKQYRPSELSNKKSG